MSARSSITWLPGSALASTSAIFRTCSERGIALAMVNLGGGFPARYVRKTPRLESYGRAIFRSLRKHFGNAVPSTIIEPGRGLVGNAGIIEAEVVLVARRSPEDEMRWVYLDIGKFHGLAETIDESICYPIRTARDRDATAPCIVAGPTCDSLRQARARPTETLRLAVDCADEIAPAVIELVERAANLGTLSVEDHNLLFWGIHVLAAARQRELFQPLIRLIRECPDDALEEVLEDAICDTLPRIIISVFDGDADTLIGACADSKVEGGVRWAMIGALARLTFDGSVARETTLAFLALLSQLKQKSLEYQGGTPKSLHYRAGAAA
jgi:hypothetical protein